MNIIVVGCSQLGVKISAKLCEHGHNVSVMDKDADTFKELPEGFNGITVCGVPVDDEILESAGITSCHALVAASYDDNLNIVVSQIAKKIYNVEHVITVIDNPSRESVFGSFGICSICPTKISASQIMGILFSDISKNNVSFGNHTVGFSTRADRRFCGKKLSDLPLFEGEMPFGILNSTGEFALGTNLSTEVKKGDAVVVARLID